MPATLPAGTADTTTLHIDGMHCASCVDHVEKALRKSPAVADASVNLATEQATIRFAPDQVGVPDLIRFIKEAGYDAHPIATEDRHQQHHASGPDQADQWRTASILGITLAAPVAILGMAIPGTLSGIVQLVLTSILQVLIGRRFFEGAVRAARAGRADMDTLVALGTTAAFLFSLYTLATGASHFYFDTTAVILALIAVGKWMETASRARARQALTGLLSLRPPIATVERDDREIDIPVDEVRAGDIILIRPGSQVPADGTVLSGNSTVDESLVTGESMPVEKAAGADVIGGTLNQTGALRIVATRTGEASVLGQIMRLVENAQASKADIQRLADRAAAVFVPIVLLIAAGTLLCWGVFAASGWSHGLSAAIAVLIVACPCALGLAVPTAIMVGSAVGARRGILIKHAAVLERAGGLDTIILDKTGTLTVGRPDVSHVIPMTGAADPALPDGPDLETRLLCLAAAIESGSEHPIGRAIFRVVQAIGLRIPEAQGFQSHVGAGVSAIVNGRRITISKPAQTDDRIESLRREGKTVVIIREGDRPLGMIAIADQLKPGAAAAVRALQDMGLNTMMLTGDSAAAGEAIAGQAGIRHVLAEVTPPNKEAKVRELQAQGQRVAMVGDGINDAPALSAADVGIAIGTGTDIAREAGDIVLLSGDIALLPEAIRLSRAMMTRIRLGLFWAFAYNIALIPLAAAGLLHPMLAAAAMSLSSVSVVLNALWLGTFGRGKPLAP